MKKTNSVQLKLSKNKKKPHQSKPQIQQIMLKIHLYNFMAKIIDYINMLKTTNKHKKDKQEISPYGGRKLF